jgi:broad specificity phosphatase PhoE
VTAEQVVLWRHGRTAANAEQRYQGQLDVPMDDVGRRQVTAAAGSLAAAGQCPPVRLVSSDLSRAAETADALARRLGLEVTRDPQLRELYAGAWQGQTHDEIRAGWPDVYAAWVRGEDVVIGGDGERRSEVASRTAAAVLRHDAEMDGGTLIVAGHGGSLRAGVFALLEIQLTAWPTWESLRNAHWGQLRRRGGGWQLQAWNVGALPVVAPSVASVPAGDGEVSEDSGAAIGV